MDILARRESTEKQDFLGIFSDHLNSEFRNLRENTNIDDSSNRANKPASRSNDPQTSCSGEGHNPIPDTSASTHPFQGTTGIFSTEEESLKNLIPVKRPSTINKNGRANVSLVVGDLSRTGPLAEMIARQTGYHWLQVCRGEDAYMYCNKEAYSIIWILMTFPVSQDLLSLTTSIRYFSKFNKETAVIGISSTQGDVDLRLHGIDEIVLQPINKFVVQQEYKKWTLVKVNPDELLTEKPNQKNSLLRVPVSGAVNFCEQPVSVTSAMPLSDAKGPPDSNPQQTGLKQIQAADSVSSNQGSSNMSSLSQRDHTTKEKRRRERIKESCDQLRVLLPYVRGRKTDMASTLEMCVDYLKLINTLLPAKTRRQVMELLGKDCSIFGQTVKVAPNKAVGSVVISQSNFSNHQTTNTKSIMTSSQTVFSSASENSLEFIKEDGQRLASVNDPGGSNPIKDRHEFRSLEKATSDSIIPDQAMKDSNLQCSKHKRPRLKDSQSLDDCLPNHSDRPKHTQTQNIPFSSSFSTNMHNTCPLIATDMRMNSHLIHPWQFASDPARVPCSRVLMSNASGNIPMNVELPVWSHYRTYLLKPQQQAHNHLQQDNPKLVRKTNTLLSSQESFHYPTGLNSFEDSKRNTMYNWYGSHYKPNNVLRTSSHLSLGRQPKTTTSTKFRALPLTETVVDGDTTARCEPSRHSTAADRPQSTTDQLSRDSHLT